jgi:hypothetical protein
MQPIVKLLASVVIISSFEGFKCFRIGIEVNASLSYWKAMTSYSPKGKSRPLFHVRSVIGLAMPKKVLMNL